MKLKVVHRTRYDYSSPVRFSYNEARLMPATGDGQECRSFSMRVRPGVKVLNFQDFYENAVHFFEVSEPHDCLVVESESVVVTAGNPLPGNRESVPMRGLGELARIDQFYDFLHTSSFVSLDPEVWRLALDAAAGCDDVRQASLEVMRFIHTNFAYAPFSTGVHTHMRDVLRQRSGVCQDFAHVMIGMCRSLKIPARYVSGYIYSGPSEHLEGAQASHGWCEVYLPGTGWLGLDPTNNLQAGEHHVKIGVGRDYADIVPIKGHYRGTAEKKMSVEVSVAPC